jgi:hypothetical protein
MKIKNAEERSAPSYLLAFRRNQTKPIPAEV